MKLISFILASFISLATFSQSNPYLQAEPTRDKSLQEFKQQLALAIEQKDTTLLYPLLGDSILESVNGLCGYCSKQNFVGINCTKNEELPYSNGFWEQAAWHLKLGFTKSTTQNPDYYANIIKKGNHLVSPPYNYYNNYDSILVLDSNVKVFKEPFKNTAVLATLTFSAMPTVNDNTSDALYSFSIYNQDEKIGYVRIKLKNGNIGYVNDSKTSQTIYKQITIAKTNGQWKIVSFYHPPGC